MNTKIDQLLNRGVDEIIDKENLKFRLERGDILRVKLGIDPTSPNIHLGRSIPLLKLKEFQDLGHQIILLIGSFTGQIGDTSDKDSERPMLDKLKVEDNLKTYIDQASKIIDIQKTEIVYNSDWLSELKYAEIGHQANAFSINEFISRDNIKKRLDEGRHVSLREVLYPLMQGYDSVVLKADVELGGVDQRFNLLAGRTLQRLYSQNAQDILMTPIIEGLDGRKMSSSYGNSVNIFDTADDMFGKIMSLKDDLIIKYFFLTTRIDEDIINSYQKRLEEGENPKNIKLILAEELVAFYHDRNSAKKALENFQNKFSNKKIIEEDLNTYVIQKDDIDLSNILVSVGFVGSKSEARRVLQEGGLKIDGQKVNIFTLPEKEEFILQKGKLNIIKIIKK